MLLPVSGAGSVVPAASCALHGLFDIFPGSFIRYRAFFRKLYLFFSEEQFLSENFSTPLP
ncbi:MAG: hypothetical protein D3917_17595 [Candidatus Electrothrix sp. AX5]|nr:hypothetical protein [Candidatus Electrothrix sp. AX5]